MADGHDLLSTTGCTALELRLEGFLQRLRRVLGDPTITREIALQILIASALERSELEGIDPAEVRSLLAQLSEAPRS